MGESCQAAHRVVAVAAVLLSAVQIAMQVWKVRTLAHIQKPWALPYGIVLVSVLMIGILVPFGHLARRMRTSAPLRRWAKENAKLLAVVCLASALYLSRGMFFLTANLPRLTVSQAPIRAAGINEIKMSLVVTALLQQAPLLLFNNFLKISTHWWTTPLFVFQVTTIVLSILEGLVHVTVGCSHRRAYRARAGGLRDAQLELIDASFV